MLLALCTVRVRTAATALVVLIIANADAVVAQRRYPFPPPPVEIEAGAIFRDAFIDVMAREGRDWQLQPARPTRLGGPARRPSGEDMSWRRTDGSSIRVWYARFASSDDAEVALAWRRELISVGTWVVKDVADEAYYPNGGRQLWFRRGAFMFIVRYEPPGPRSSLEPVRTSNLCSPPNSECVVIRDREAVLINSGVHRISELFLAAAGVLSDPIRP